MQQKITRKSKGTISATNLAAYHHYQCDLYLYNTYHGPRVVVADEGQRNHHGRGNTTSAITGARLSRGVDWESTLLDWLDKQDLLVRVSSGALDAAELKSLIELILDEHEHVFITGLALRPPESVFQVFFDKFKTRPVKFAVAKLDLLEIKRDQNGLMKWQVIDAKASTDVQTSHHVQIYFYHLCIQSMLAIPFLEPMDTASVWLAPKSSQLNSSLLPSFDGIKTISIRLLSISLDEFFFQRLPTILDTPYDTVKWHFNALCEGCPFEGGCSKRALTESKLGAMSNISVQDSRTLEDFIAIANTRRKVPEMTDIESLDQIVRSAGTMEYLRSSHPVVTKRAERILKVPSKRGTSGLYSPVLDAAKTGKLQVIPKRVFTMPMHEDIAVVITLVLHPQSKSILRFCVSAYSRVDYYMPAPAATGDVTQLIPALAKTLHAILELPDYYSPPPRTQCYTFSLQEHTALVKHLIDAAVTNSTDPTGFTNNQAAVRLCVGALCDGAELLATSLQPSILSGALLGFLDKKGERSENEMHRCLNRLGIPQSGARVKLEERLREEIERLKDEEYRHLDDPRPEIGRLSRLVVVKHEIGKLLVLPFPGAWDLPECFSALSLRRISIHAPGEDQVYTAYKDKDYAQLQNLLALKNDCVYMVVRKLRRRVLTGSSSSADRKPASTEIKLQGALQNVFVNNGKVLTAQFMDLCKQEHLRKLFFMQQFEVMTKLQQLWWSRIDGCPEAPLLAYKFTRAQGYGKYIHTFELLSGHVEAPSDKSHSYYEYILCEDTPGDTSTGLPVEALFNDLLVYNLKFPLPATTRRRWDLQPREVRDNIFVVDIEDVTLNDHGTLVICKTWGAFHLRLCPGKIYRISPRLVDFNLNKVLSTLIELDLQTPPNPPWHLIDPPVPTYLRFIVNPRIFSTLKALHSENSDSDSLEKRLLEGEREVFDTYRELSCKGVKFAEKLTLMRSQRSVLRRILTHRLSVVWGPPGTGKTYTVALSLLRLLELQHRCGLARPQNIFITAMTHAAIRACFSRILQLREDIRSIQDQKVDNKWLDNIEIEHVLSGWSHKAPVPVGQKIRIYAGTVFQLYNFARRHSLQASIVIFDEAGQLGLGPASLVLRALESKGRIILAGDSEQLAPILTTEYPKDNAALFGSVLVRAMDQVNGEFGSCIENTSSNLITGLSGPSTSAVVQLRENFRLNDDLSDFVSTIYSRKLESKKVPTEETAMRLLDLTIEDHVHGCSKDAHAFLLSLAKSMLCKPQEFLRPPIISPTQQTQSLALIQLQTHHTRPELSGMEAYVRGEATLAADLVRWLNRALPGESIFVATPRRIQRHAVKEALKEQTGDVDMVNLFEKLNLGGASGNDLVSGKVTVDTVERLQGSEASFVICLFSLPPSQHTLLNFFLDRRRLNVAISRAKTLCIVITSPTVLRPPVNILTDPAVTRGWEFLRSFEERAWVGDIDLDLDDAIPKRTAQKYKIGLSET